ncbi:transcription termination factor NusA [Candidatus Gracilibacteria bacterium]|nr:transcription termination factor NusA [Candidatus Gracilibacteria bacterium]NUJ98383.1 transcription termination factor NusA [Candidatus Gracilibacteria bacterium]
MLDIKKIEAAINMISAEKKIPKEKLIEIIEAAIRTAYKKDYGYKDEKVNVHLNLESGEIEITVEKTLVREVQNPALEISFEELGDDAEGFQEGDTIELDMTDDVMGDNAEAFGRIASQAARQVIIQKIGDTEKEKIYDIFVGKEGTVVSMKVDLVEGGKVIFDYNGNQIILPKNEQVSRDTYSPGARFYVYIAEVSNTDGANPKVILSRKRAEIVPAIFSQYVPEVIDGIVVIDRVVRHPGVKTKMLVSTAYDEIDPVGTLIGQKGMRVKSVMEELSGEKIDIISNTNDIKEIIAKALTPAEVERVEIDEENGVANVFIKQEERAKAVGKGGVNVNLAADLVGYKISLQEID